MYGLGPRLLADAILHEQQNHLLRIQGNQHPIPNRPESPFGPLLGRFGAASPRFLFTSCILLHPWYSRSLTGREAAADRESFGFEVRL